MGRVGIGIAALLMAGTLEAQCFESRKQLTIGYAIPADARLDVVRANKDALFAEVSSYFSGKGIDLEFKEGDGEYDLKFTYRHRIRDAWVLWRWLQLGAAHEDHRHAYINIYAQTTPRGDPKGFIRKYAQTIEHELGHLAGLRHSKTPGNLLFRVTDSDSQDLTCEQITQMHVRLGAGGTLEK